MPLNALPPNGQRPAGARSAPEGRLVVHQQPGQIRRREFAGYTAEDLAGLIRRVERGDQEALADLCAFMLRTDAHVRSLVDTRILSVTGARWEMRPGDASPEAQAAAEFCQRSLSSCRTLSDVLRRLVYGGEMVGTGGIAEHCWYERDGTWHSEPMPVPQRDVGYTQDWRIAARTYADGRPEWLPLAGEHPARFIAHTPMGLADTPHMSGVLMSICWEWLFKRWCVVWRADGLERFANPKIWGKLATDADETALSELFDGLKNLSADHIGVFQQGTEVQIDATGTDVGDAWTATIQYFNGELTKGVLGSTLAVDIGSGQPGSRAASEVQSTVTILPRLLSDAERLQSTVERQWLRPLLYFNRHLFGGVVPPIPRFRFRLVQEDERKIDNNILSAALSAGLVRKDELRKAVGLEPLGSAAGGDDFLPAKVEQPDRGFSAALSDAGSPRHATIAHTPGCEWRVVSGDGASMGVYATKAEAVARLQELESAATVAASDV